MEKRSYTLEEILGMMSYAADYDGNMTCKLPGSLINGCPNNYGINYSEKRLQEFTAKLYKRGWIKSKGAGPVITEKGYRVAVWPF